MQMAFTHASTILAQDLAILPKLSNRVTDTVGILNQQQKRELEGLLQGFEQQKGSQLVVVIVPTVKPESIEQYAIRLAERWKIGREKIDDGAILLVALQDRKLRIEVGYGLEGVLTDITSKRIIEDTITPAFKQGAYYQGIKAGVETMMQVVSGESLPEPTKTRTASFSKSSRGVLLLFLVLLFFSGLLLRSVAGGGIAFFVNLIIGGILGYFFFSLAIGMFMAFFSSIAMLTRGSYLGGMGYHHYGGYGGYGAGGFGGGGFGGGFGGGGGGFGGGGASGSW